MTAAGRLRWLSSGRCGAVLAALILSVCGAGCGQSSPPAATLAAQAYLNALAEGNYAGACALIDRPARRKLTRSAGRRVTCPAAYARCLPNRAQVAKQDQSQLLFATVQTTIDGSRAAAAVSGTPVADAVRRVTLAKEGRHWLLTSPGQALSRCRAGGARRRRGRRATGR